MSADADHEDRPEDRFESEFTVATAPAAVWERLAANQALDLPPGDWWLPGFSARVRELERRDGELLRAEKLEEPCAGTEIALTLEASGSGTRVRIVQSGFGARWQFRDLLAVGWAYIVADLALFLDRGVRADRHLRAWAAPGWFVRDAPAGPEVVSVQPGSPAAALGVAPGDLIIAVAAAPVVDAGQLETAIRVAGTAPVEVEWVGAGGLHRAELHA